MGKTAPAEGWFRRLADGRVEVFLRAGETKVRAHGSEAAMNEVVDWFEQQTSVTVEMSWRTRAVPKQIPGQESFDLTLTLGEQTEPVLEE